jgi:predicted house-cleaning NTP pyrophosphatase (Maf/HAM1 superfamily)
VRMLRLLKGRPHDVHTGVAVVSRSGMREGRGRRLCGLRLLRPRNVRRNSCCGAYPYTPRCAQASSGWRD